MGDDHTVTSEELHVCRLRHDPTERFVAKEWWTFEGVKGGLVFLEAADGDDYAGMPFRVVDVKTGKKIFEDSASGMSHMGFGTASDGAMYLRYLRRVGGDCSIPQDGRVCWNKFTKHYGLAFAAMPRCLGYRHEGQKEWTVGDEGVPPEKIETPSALDYPAVVELFPRPSIRAIPGPVRCFPVQ